MPNVSRYGEPVSRHPQRVAVGFLLPTTAAGVSALLIPGYIRPDPWHAIFVSLTVFLAVAAWVIYRARQLPPPAVVLLVLAMDGVIVVADLATTDVGGPVSFVMFALPTTYVALFLSQRMFSGLQVPAAVLGVNLIFWLAGERDAVLALHAALALSAVLGPPLALFTLRRRLEAALSRERDLAGTDPLTGLANRRGLAARAALVAGHAQREAVQLCVVTLDIDHFKCVNDTYGHGFGDVVLQRISETLQSNTRALDVVARLGGEEFAVLSALSADDALALAIRLREAIALDFSDLGVTASLGMASLAPPHEDEVETTLWRLVDQADEYMYVAKRLGRNRVVTAQVGDQVGEQLIDRDGDRAPGSTPSGDRSKVHLGEPAG